MPDGELSGPEHSVQDLAGSAVKVPARNKRHSKGGWEPEEQWESLPNVLSNYIPGLGQLSYRFQE